MKETIFDVLIYLFENYMESERDYLPDTDVIRGELMEVGFEQLEINRAFAWLESLSLESTIAQVSSTFRIFSPQEQAKLEIDCRNLLLFLEYNGVLSPANRERVIDRAMALADAEISLDELKWIILMVLLNQTDAPTAFSDMEDFIYDLSPAYLH
jgi:Smg protein